MILFIPLLFALWITVNGSGCDSPWFMVSGSRFLEAGSGSGPGSGPSSEGRSGRSNSYNAPKSHNTLQSSDDPPRSQRSTSSDRLGSSPRPVKGHEGKALESQQSSPSPIHTFFPIGTDTKHNTSPRSRHGSGCDTLECRRVMIPGHALYHITKLVPILYGKFPELQETRKQRGLSWSDLFEEYDSPFLEIFAKEFIKISSAAIRKSVRDGRFGLTDCKYLIRNGFADVLASAIYCPRSSHHSNAPNLLNLLSYSAKIKEEALFKYLINEERCQNSPEVQDVLKTTKFWKLVHDIEELNEIYDMRDEYLTPNQLDDLYIAITTTPSRKHHKEYH